MGKRAGTSPRISVLLCTEGTYPFYPGGVSTWCATLVHRLRAVDYTIFSVQMDPFIAQQYQLPKGTQLVRVPLWGTEEPSEHLDQRFSTTYLSKQRTTAQVIEDKFLPLFTKLVQHIISVRKDPLNFADVVVELYDFFSEYDYKVSFKSPIVWEAYKRIIMDAVRNSDYGLQHPDIYSLMQSLGWVYRFFNIINTPVPHTTITHASAAAFCGLPCVIAKRKFGTPFLLTEHGVYLREQYLSLSKRGYPGFMNTFLIRLIQTVVDLNYALADQISPVCDYNTRWERVMTDRHERIEVIYNGVDHSVFTKVRSLEHVRPTVVIAARVDPIKDILTMIRAADIVRQEIPSVRFLLYGAVSVPEYQIQCEHLVKELKLEDTFVFMGETADVAAAYENGDVVALSSISEAFPYTIVEAMLAGKAVVSTDVGGIPEALGEAGVLVPPGDPTAFAAALNRVLLNPGLRQEMGDNARERALSLFTLEKSLDRYLKTYVKLALGLYPGFAVVPAAQTRQNGDETVSSVPVTSAADTVVTQLLPAGRLQELYMQRGYALLDAGFLPDALDQLVVAVETNPTSPAVPILLVDIARLQAWERDFSTASRIIEASETYHSRLIRQRQQLLAERGFALAANGLYHEAVRFLKRAVALQPDNLAVPLFCLELSRLYERIGRPAQAELELVKYQLVAGDSV